MTAPTIFISYSHRDEEWKDRLVSHLGVLKKEGLLDVWDDRRIEIGDDWQSGIEKAINQASIAILMISANFLTSKFILDEEVPKFLTRREKEGLRVIPLIVKPCAWTQVKWLSSIQAQPKDARPLSVGNEYRIDSDLAVIANEISKIVKRGELGLDKHQLEQLPVQISLAKLPSTSPDLFGREDRLRELNAAWEDPNINILSLVAWGGVGKTALINKWLTEMGRDNYRGAERIFGWSFYSQGAAEGRQVSADQFIATSLEWFGDEDPTQGSPWDKGERLAELIKTQRTLLILDGLEPLQNPPPVETGRIKDPGLTSLLRELARQNPGLVVITTRLSVDDLKDFIFPFSSRGMTKGGAVLEIDLENLSDESGAAYLKHLGVDGIDAERQQASRDFGGHALALTLLGRYLKVVHNGDIRKRGEIPHVMDEQKQGAHSRRVMESYERWLRGKPELEILRLVGLFDRPAEKGALNALRKEPAIVGLTDAIQKLSDSNWKFAVNNLRELRILAPEDQYEPETLDCHPLLREHFGEKLKLENENAWREASGRLYEYYKSTAKEFPDTIQEMAPLYAAIMYGCQAGRHQEVLDDVYWPRVSRGNEHFNVGKLGDVSGDLTLLFDFFDRPWHKPIPTLREEWKSFVLNKAGFDLRALGRLSESAQLTQAGLEADLARKDWKNAVVSARNLSELYQTIGDLQKALSYAEQSVELADHTEDTFNKIVSRTVLANALQRAGRLSEAEELFRAAETMQQQRQPEFPLLYSLQGYSYCDLLLSKHKIQDVQHRASQTLEWARQYFSLLDLALDYLSLGRSHFFQSRLDSTYPISESALYLNRAIDGLRQAGDQSYLARGLLARTEYYRVTGDLVKARKDLDEAFSIAVRSDMMFHVIDCHLEYAYLARVQNSDLQLKQESKVREHLATAKYLIAKTGYHLRDSQIAELEGTR